MSGNYCAFTHNLIHRICNTILCDNSEDIPNNIPNNTTVSDTSPVNSVILYLFCYTVVNTHCVRDSWFVSNVLFSILSINLSYDLFVIYL